MSTFTAVSAVTRALVRQLNTRLLEGVRPDPDSVNVLTATRITTLSPDKARTALVPQVNVFLFQVQPDAAWRNADVPRQTRPGEVGMPPLALTLYYLFTVYGADDDELLSQSLLGWLMSQLNDFPLLSPADVPQAERVRITLQPMTLDEMSNLWMIFQTPYHLSVVYQVSVVLIDSARTGPAALPVLRRGPEDAGPTAQAGLFPPVLEAVSLGQNFSVARLGDRVTLRGQNLARARAVVFTSPYQPALKPDGTLAEPAVTPVRIDRFRSKTDSEIQVDLDPTLAWIAGLLTVKVVFALDAEHELSSNELPFALAPTYRLPLDDADLSQQGDDRLLTLAQIAPAARVNQRVIAVLSPLTQATPDAQIAADPPTDMAPRSEIKFKVTGLQGHFLVRLRVDGMDRVALAKDNAGKPIFDPGQEVRLP